MPLSSQLHTPKLMGEDDMHIKYACAADEYEAEGHETKTVEGVVLTMAKRKSDGKMGVVFAAFKKPDFDKDKAGAWLAAQKFSVEPADLHSVQNVEIFSTGLWNGKQITDQDLDHIVTAFTATRAKGVAPALKLGHDDHQKLLQSDGLPAAGWVENVRKVGSKLVADFVDIPKRIYQLMMNKAYRKVSCEIYNNVDINGEKFPKMLGAVALLGSDLPGVLNLSDILSMYACAREGSKFDLQSAVDIISLPDQILIQKSEGEDMPQEVELYKSELEQAKKDVDAFKAQVTEKDAEIATLKKAAEDAQAEVVKVALEKKKALVDAFVTEIKAEKLCSAAMEPMVRDLLGEDKEAYSHGEKSLSKSELLKEILKASKEAAKVNFSETTKDEDSSDRQDLEKQIEKFANDNKVSYSAAYKAVTKGKDLAAKAMYQEETDA